MTYMPETFVFTDIEASSLGIGSFPIEIGWAGVDMVPHHFLIKPHENWTKRIWNPESEKIHNISWDQLMDEGIDPNEAAERVLDAFRNKIIVSDSPFYEAKWFLRLFETLGIDGQFVRYDPSNKVMTSIIDIYEAWGEAIKADRTGCWKNIEDVIDITEKVMEVFPHTHRASDDAIQLAATFKILVEPEWDYRSARANFLPIGLIV